MEGIEQLRSYREQLVQMESVLLQTMATDAMMKEETLPVATEELFNIAELIIKIDDELKKNKNNT
jgi:hypothetical protein